MVLDTGRQTGSPIDDLVPAARRIGKAIESVIEGKREAIQLTLTVLLAEGHLLIEDVPGVGKTMLAKALARSIDCTVRRVQFTPDLLPSDITGVSVYNQERRDFEFKPGPVFANIVLGDEINRASPKTQSALLECHGGAPGHGRRHHLRAARAVHGDRHPEPDRDGGHLPAARGAARPVHRAHLDRLPAARRRAGDARHARRRLAAGPAQAGRAGQRRAGADRARSAGCYVSDQVKDYIISLANATRTSPELRLGASPRAAAAPAPRQPGLGRAGRAGLRDPRRRAAAGQCRCSRTGCCPPPRPSWSGTCPSRWSTGSSPSCRLPRPVSLRRGAGR